MSVKNQLAREIADLPESVTIEEAIERIYRAFKLKQALAGRTGQAHPAGPARQEKGLSIPEEVVHASHLKPAELMQEIALLLYQQDRLTLAQASRLAAMPQQWFQFLLASKGIPIHYGVSEFDADLQTLRQMGRL